MARSTISMLAGALLLSACSVGVEPLSDEDHAARADAQLAELTDVQEPVAGTIDIYEAMARAIKYNLDHQVEVHRALLALRGAKVASLEMLPNLVANSNYAGRSQSAFSYSQSLGAARGVTPSRSAERSTISGDLSFSWNILDFGISYVRAKQEADKALVVMEDRRRVLNEVTENVRAAYWRAVSAERLLRGFGPLENRIRKALKNSNSLTDDGLTSPEAQLLYQRELLDVQRQIDRIKGQLLSAKIELGALMNLAPGTHFHIELPNRDVSALNFGMDVEDMRKHALMNRPELRTLAYDKRISSKEAQVALLEILPGLQLNLGSNHDSNSYLMTGDWISWGTRATWNLISLVKYKDKKERFAQEEQTIHQESLALAMSILTQIEVARLSFDHLKNAAHTGQRYLSVQNKILRNVKNTAEADALSEQSVIREEMNLLVASAELDVTFSELQAAFARKFSSIGMDPYGEGFDPNAPVAELADNLRRVWSSRGDLAVGQLHVAKVNVSEIQELGK